MGNAFNMNRNNLPGISAAFILFCFFMVIPLFGFVPLLWATGGMLLLLGVVTLLRRRTRGKTRQESEVPPLSSV